MCATLESLAHAPVQRQVGRLCSHSLAALWQLRKATVVQAGEVSGEGVSGVRQRLTVTLADGSKPLHLDVEGNADKAVGWLKALEQAASSAPSSLSASLRKSKRTSQFGGTRTQPLSPTGTHAKQLTGSHCSPLPSPRAIAHPHGIRTTMPPL